MRSVIAACLVFAASRGEARPRPAPAPPPAESEFWRDVVEPHGDEVRQLVTKAKNALSQPDTAALTSDADWAVDQKLRFYRDAYNLLRYARKLSPQNLEVLTQLGRAADELGKTREALDALEAAVRVTGPDKASPEVAGRLGTIYLRLGDRDRAIRWLRQAQGPITLAAPALVHLANALEAHGDVGGAIDVLQNALPNRALSFYYASEMTLVAFALAVVYDRDEQRAAAFDVLEHMKRAMNTQYAPQVANELAKLRFAPPEDEHYFKALFYESLEHFVEARAEWGVYAAIPDAPWRQRALDHVAAIDALRRAPKPVKPAAEPIVPKVVP